MPGGFGTLDEMFEAITLIQTKKIAKFPIILVGTAFWSGLIDWVKEVLVAREKTVSEKDLDLFKIVDTEDLYLIALTCLFLASKFLNNENNYSLGDLCNYTKNRFNR